MASGAPSPPPKATHGAENGGISESAAAATLARGAQVAVWASAEALVADGDTSTSSSASGKQGPDDAGLLHTVALKAASGVGIGAVACVARAHGLLPVATAFRVGVSCRGDAGCPPLDMHKVLGRQRAETLGAVELPALALAGETAVSAAAHGLDAPAAILSPGGLIQACVRLSTGASSAVLAVRALTWTLVEDSPLCAITDAASISKQMNASTVPVGARYNEGGTCAARSEDSARAVLVAPRGAHNLLLAARATGDWPHALVEAHRTLSAATAQEVAHPGSGLRAPTSGPGYGPEGYLLSVCAAAAQSLSRVPTVTGEPLPLLEAERRSSTGV